MLNVAAHQLPRYYQRQQVIFDTPRLRYINGTNQHVQKYWKSFDSRQGAGKLGLISGRVIPKTQKMILDTSLFNNQHYTVRFKGKVEQFRERSCTHTLYLGVVAIKKGSFRVALDYGCQLYFFT